MKLTYLLEMSAAKPRQFRITVLEDTVMAIITHRANDTGPHMFQHIGAGYYATREECFAALAPYIGMENG